MKPSIFSAGFLLLLSIQIVACGPLPVPDLQASVTGSPSIPTIIPDSPTATATEKPIPTNTATLVPTATEVFPFKPTIFDFENQTSDSDIEPWFLVPESKPYSAIISPDFFHSGKYSFRMVVDMQSAAIDPDTEYAGIGFKVNLALHAKAIVAWVFIPESEPIQNILFKAHILAYHNNNTGKRILFIGEDTQVIPGNWTPLFIGTFGETGEDPDKIVWNGTIDELYLTIWSNDSYNGSIYFDDISIYK